MTDYETHPIGTADKIKRLEAVVEAARRVLGDAGYGGWDLQASYSYLRKTMTALEKDSD